VAEREARVALLRGIDAVRLEVEALRAETEGDRQRARELGRKARALIRRAFAELEGLEPAAEVKG
jgi:hypothetical protein